MESPATRGDQAPEPGKKPIKTRSELILYGVIYGDKDRIILKQNPGSHPFPGKVFMASYSKQDASSLDAARAKISKELNHYYGVRCQKDTNKECSLEKVSNIDFSYGRVEIFNCPECKGSNSPEDSVANIYHIAVWDDAPEVGTNTGNQFVGTYDADTHRAFAQIQKNSGIVQELKNWGYRWGL